MAESAFLEVRTPTGELVRSAVLTSGRVTVGRPSPGSEPDIALGPDPQQWISRVHCVVERSSGVWWVSDNGTRNGTFLHRGEGLERIEGRRRLNHGDVVAILADQSPEGPRYWELRLVDPFGTAKAPTPEVQPSRPCLQYDSTVARVYRWEDGRRTEVLIPRNAHKLLSYMAGRNEANGGAAVLCAHDELIRAVWGDRSPSTYRRYTAENVRDLVNDVRKRIEVNPQQPVLLVSVHGLGYRLVSCWSSSTPDGA